MTQALPRSREVDAIAPSASISHEHSRKLQVQRAEVVQERSSLQLGIVIEEADETLLWLELSGESGIVKPSRLQRLARQSKPIISILCGVLAHTKKVWESSDDPISGALFHPLFA